MPILNGLGISNESVNISRTVNFAQKYGAAMLREYVNEAEFAQHFPVDTEVVNEKGFMKLTVDGMIGPYTGKIENDGGEAIYSHRKLSVSVGQANLAFDPETIRPNVRANQININITKGSQIADQGLILAEFMDRLMSGFNDRTFYKGDTALVATPSNKDLRWANGLEKVMLACIAASGDRYDGITPVVTPAFDEGSGFNANFTAGNVIESFQSVDDSFEYAYKKMARTMFVSHGVFRKFTNDYRRRYKNDPTYQKYDKGPFGFVYLQDTAEKVKIAPATWLGNSNRVIDVIDGSIVIGCDIPGMMTSFDVQKIGFFFHFMCKSIFGVQIIDPKGVRVNTLA